MPVGDLYAADLPERAAEADGGVVMSALIMAVKDGGVVYLSEDGNIVAAVAPLEVVEAGLRVLGRSGESG